jgi:hypothetical protein
MKIMRLCQPASSSIRRPAATRHFRRHLDEIGGQSALKATADLALNSLMERVHEELLAGKPVPCSCKTSRRPSPAMFSMLNRQQTQQTQN